MPMEIGAQVHMFANGRIINAIITEFLLGGKMAVLTDSNGNGRFTRMLTELNPGWLMLGADATSSGVGLP
jgi:hypothetical protein